MNECDPAGGAARAAAIARVPVYAFAGWYDSGSVVSGARLLTTSGAERRLTIGPWTHGARLACSAAQLAAGGSLMPRFDMYADVANWLDEQRAAVGPFEAGEAVHYCGASARWEDGDKLEYGAKGEVVGPSDDDDASVEVRFPGNEDAVDCRQSEPPASTTARIVSRVAAMAMTQGPCRYRWIASPPT